MSPLSARWSRRTEDLAALLASAAVAVFVSWSYLRPEIVQGDALVHHYWMRRGTNGSLFNDPLTAQLQESARYPHGYELLFEIAARFTDPVVFGEWLGVGLMAASGWLVFRIVRFHTTWWPAAWLGGALFLGLSDIHRFYGGFPRGFTQPAVLLTVLLSMTDRHLGAAAVASVTALFYPPAALLAVGVLLVASLQRKGRRGLRLDAIRARFAVAALALTLLATAGPVIVGDRPPELMTAQQARAYPEFTGRFFEPSVRTYLQQNRSGFDLRASGSLLALAALALLAVRPSNRNLLRTEVLALPVVALGGFTLAHGLLFRLYLPHRYTYPLLAFAAIAIAVTLRPTWTFVMSRRRAWLTAIAVLSAPVVLYRVALHHSPLGPQAPAADGLATPPTAALGGTTVALSAVAAKVMMSRVPDAARPAAGAAVTGVMLVGALIWLPGGRPHGTRCAHTVVTQYMATLPRTAIIAGDPEDLNCLPLTARRAVVISRKIAPSYEFDHFLENRSRMFAMLRAYYGPSLTAVSTLDRRYGATHMWIRRAALRNEAMARDGIRWVRGTRPYGTYVRGLLDLATPVTLNLPRGCLQWKHGPNEIYAIRCLVQRETPQHRRNRRRPKPERRGKQIRQPLAGDAGYCARAEQQRFRGSARVVGGRGRSHRVAAVRVPAFASAFWLTRRRLVGAG